MGFNTKIVGVTYDNDDGTNRQNIIKELTINTKLKLERDHENKHDLNAVKVLTEDGRQLGWLNKTVARKIAGKIEEGGHESALISAITGGGKESLGVNVVIDATGKSNYKESTIMKNNPEQICKECKFKNPANAKFCEECGFQLLIECFECNQVNPTSKKFCPQCGANTEIYEALKKLDKRLGLLLEDCQWDDVIDEYSNLPDTDKLHGNTTIKLFNEVYAKTKAAKKNKDRIFSLKTEIDNDSDQPNESVIKLIDELLQLNPDGDNSEYMELRSNLIKKESNRIEEEDLQRRIALQEKKKMMS